MESRLHGLVEPTRSLGGPGQPDGEPVKRRPAGTSRGVDCAGARLSPSGAVLLACPNIEPAWRAWAGLL